MCMKDKKILVTGGLGFIGRTLLEALITKNCGAKLYAIDIKDMPKDADLLRHNVDFQRLDIRDEIAVKNYIKNKNFDGIVHLAAVSRVVDAEKDKQNCIKTNFKGTKYIAEAAAENPDCWMIFGSSREVYGEQNVLPVAENAELLPMNIYGFYKLEGERIIKSTVKRYCILRFSNVYGNDYDIPTRVIPAFVRTAMSGGEITLEGGSQVIDFTHINDTVQAIIKCMQMLDSKRFESETIHVLPGVANKITDIIDILREMGLRFSVKVNPPRNYDVQRFVGNPSHLRETLGNVAVTDLRTGIKKLLEIYQRSSH